MRIGVVLVTCNRLACLRQALAAYERQTRLPDRVIVVDNHSTDGTAQFLAEWQAAPRNTDYQVCRLAENLGGAGGFAHGLEESLRQSFDWVLAADDDACPGADYLALLEAAALGNGAVADGEPADGEPAAVAGRVVNGGKTDLWHRRRIHRGLLRVREVPVAEEEYTQEVFPIDEFSYVGVLLNCRAMARVGVTDAGYFLHYDDTEHALRLGAGGALLCVPGAVIHHDTPVAPGQITWKHYYSLRNFLHMLGAHFPPRYCRVEALVQYLKKGSLLAALLRGRTREERRLCRAAIADGLRGRRGRHKLYAPGWQPGKGGAP